MELSKGVKGKGGGVCVIADGERGGRKAAKKAGRKANGAVVAARERKI